MQGEDFKSLKKQLSINIKLLRKSQGLAQERLGLEAGVDRTVISKIEREIGNPSLEILVKIASFLGVSVTELLQNPNNK
jgi:transcriptional regulator with XRE-family HTH domain